MKTKFFLMFLTLSIAVLSAALGQDTIVVSLKKAVLPDTGQLTGISNILFARPDSVHSGYPSE